MAKRGKAKPKAKAKAKPNGKQKAARSKANSKVKRKAARSKANSKVKGKTAKRRSPPRRPPPPPLLPIAGLEGQLFGVLETMRDRAARIIGKIALQVRRAPSSAARTPWLLVGRFVFDGIVYDDLGSILRDWRDSRTIERRINPQRLSRLQVEYDPDRGKRSTYTISEIAPWGLAISRAYQRVAVQDDRLESLVARYGSDSDRQSEIHALYVWFSPTLATQVYY